MFHSRTFRSIVILIVALVFASTAYAMAASNTLADAGKAGDGNSGITGYDVTGVSYNLYSSDPSLVESVEFDLDAAASDVQASIDGTFGTCSNGGSGNHWTCTFPTSGASTVTALSASNLRVIAAQ
jgi:hypothetical protein